MFPILWYKNGEGNKGSWREDEAIWCLLLLLPHTHSRTKETTLSPNLSFLIERDEEWIRCRGGKPGDSDSREKWYNNILSPSWRETRQPRWTSPKVKSQTHTQVQTNENFWSYMTRKGKPGRGLRKNKEGWWYSLILTPFVHIVQVPWAERRKEKIRGRREGVKKPMASSLKRGSEGEREKRF